MPPGGFGSEVVAGNLEEFEPGSVNYVREGLYIVRRTGACLPCGSAATPGLHRTWREDQNQFNCPCHSSFFNRQAEVTGGPAPRPVDLFPVSLQDSKLVVDTSQPIQRQQFDDSQVFFPS
jgi:cytochrome b6-f complex iron-sulfur subunit